MKNAAALEASKQPEKGPQTPLKITEDDLSTSTEVSTAVTSTSSTLTSDGASHSSIESSGSSTTNSTPVSSSTEVSPSKSAVATSDGTAPPSGDDSQQLVQLLPKELIEAIKSIGPESIKLDINPNVFLSCPCDVDPEVMQKDEQVARNISIFLYESVLPYITERIRESDLLPSDNTQLVNVLHSHGINMRYLGKLADIAREQITEDEKLFALGQRRIQPMPVYWLHMLEIEIIARCVKHILSDMIRENRSIRTAPGGTIALLLNHILGTQDMYCGLCDDVDSTTPPKPNGKKKKGQKGNKKGAAIPNGHGAVSFITSNIVPSPAVVSISRDKVWTLLSKEMESRFCYNILNIKLVGAIGPINSLNEKISKLVLLRRICQMCNIR